MRITKDSETKEFMIVMQFASQGNSRHNFHSGNILQIYHPGAQSNISYITKIRCFGVIMAGLSSGNPPFIKENMMLNFGMIQHLLEVIKKKNLATKAKKLKAMFKEADKEIPKKYQIFDAIYTSGFTSNNLSNPINSSIITSDIYF
ncbi:hypothetical protein C1646_762241 [Rhizophagus diaphanus]|nr:hypothetical protein C1646_762241 [Rhizophagus diaphanus] [Rhizophagus sp. MUCL 43196]